jgi:hypothetical protein
MTAARRLAAILAADVVGYSRLMGEDEAGTGQPHSARLKSGMLACSYLHALNAGDGCSGTSFGLRAPRYTNVRPDLRPCQG